MHYDVLLILKPPFENLREKLAEVLRPFKVDWDDGPTSAERWDWYSLPDDGPFADAGVLDLVSGFDVPSRVCRMSRLPSEYVVSAAITPDGVWHDIQDFGWRLVDEGSPQNGEARARWQAHFREIVAQHADAIGVEVHCHG